MLLYSWKEAVKLFIYTVLINTLVAVVITIYWPLFWMRTIAFTYLGTAFGGGGEIATLIEQLEYLAIPFAALFALVITAVFMGLRKLKRSGKGIGKIRVRENDVYALSAVNAVVMLLPLIYLGRNDGAFISYFLQLWMHSVTVVAILSFERMINNDHKYIFGGIYAVIALFTVYFGMSKLPQHILTDEEISRWHKAYEYITDYEQSGDIFYARSLAYDSFDDKDGDCLCGHDAEVSEKTVKNIENSGFSAEWFPYMEQLVDQNMDYRNAIVQKAKDHEYSLITIDPAGDYHILDGENSTLYGYRIIDTLELQLGNMPYEVEFYALN